MIASKSFLITLVAVCLLTTTPFLVGQTDQKVTTLYRFNKSDGEKPFGALIEGKDGAFYGTTGYGGENGNGTIFKITTKGVLTTLHSFDHDADGAYCPAGRLAQDSKGNFYGTTVEGGYGCGTVFKITAAGDFVTLYSFSGDYNVDGVSPYDLIRGSDGNFYGTTSGEQNVGTVFKITPQGAFTLLHAFTEFDSSKSSNSMSIYGGLMEGHDGMFYGTTATGGSNNAGTVFKITPTGAVTFLHNFDPEGKDQTDEPRGVLVQDIKGNLYGITSGVEKDGAIFKITPEGIFSILHSFAGSDGGSPFGGLVQGNDGDFYGTTYSTVFKITESGTFTTLYTFTTTAFPHAALVKGSDSNLYGTTSGDYSEYVNPEGDYGTVFKVNGVAPIVFIPGIAGSVLKGGISDTELWPTFIPGNINQLALGSMATNVQAVDLVENISLVFGAEKIHFYDKLLDHFTKDEGHEYTMFLMERDPSRMTSTYMLDYAQAHPDAQKPTFFPYPYDWRKSNSTHTQELRDYIKRIKELHGGSKVNVVTHSMGGLLLRRYFLDYPQDAATDIGRVVTVVCPYWGSPKSIYRMLSGNFYFSDDDVFTEAGESLFDSINRDSMKIALATLPGVHELLPTDLYFTKVTNDGQAALAENSFDLNGNGSDQDIFLGTTFRPVLDQQVKLLEPSILPASVNSINFHTPQQDNSSGDEANGISILTLHLCGVQNEKGTTIRTIARHRTLVGTLQGDKISLTGTPYYDEDFGYGDGVVPKLSATRTSDSMSSTETVTEVRDSDKRRVEHNRIMQNKEVWKMISDFLDSETRPAAIVYTSQAAMSKRALSATSDSPTPVVTRVRIFGTGYVKIRDASGNENTQFSDIAAKPVPGITAKYGGDDPWVDLKTANDTEFTIEPDDDADGLEIEITSSNAEGDVTDLKRYRFMPGDKTWQLHVVPTHAPELKVDANGDGSLDSTETVALTNDSDGGAVDMTPPELTMILTKKAKSFAVAFSATDDVTASPDIHYTVNDGAVQGYGAALGFKLDQPTTLKAFAEDEMGNTSSLLTLQLPLEHLADGTISLIGGRKPIGKNRYDASGASEAVAAKLKRNTAKTALITIQNEGKAMDTLRVKANAGESGNFAIKYRLNKKDVTAEVEAGTLTVPNLKPGHAVTLKAIISVKKLATKGEVFQTKIDTWSDGDPTPLHDAVIYAVTVK